MVASKSKKAAKYTYAERVLGALSQVQKDQRKHAVHLATIRAQVRKTAQAKKDKLGPQWASWVGKAVHRLEDDGILRAVQQSGNVTLTPDGKKAIAAARRSLSLGAYVSPSPTQEDVIWKQVSRQFSGRGLKRKQPSRRRFSTVDADEEDDDEEEEVLSTLRRGTRSKKARISMGSGKTPVSQMTKAELKAELKSLKQAYAKTLSEAPNASQEVDTDEARRLKDELKQRQEEIDAIRTELAELKHATAVDETMTHYEGGTISRAMTPEPSFDVSTSSPTRPNPANVFGRSRPLLGVTRTHSGSLISAISKQPTPAPSSPEMYPVDTTFGGNDDVFSAQAEDEMDGRSRLNATTCFHALATPDSTPSRVVGSREAELSKEVQMYKTLVEDMQRTSQESEKVSQDKIMCLESALACRASDVQSLKGKHAELLSERLKMEESIFNKDSQISGLQAEIDTIRTLIAQKDDVISSKELRIVDLQSAGAGSSQLLASQDAKVAELEKTIRDRDASIVALTQDRESCVMGLELALQESKALQVTAADEVALLTSRQTSLNDRLQSAEASKVSLSEELRTALEQKSATSISLTEAQSSIESLTAQLTNSNKQVLGLTNDARELQDQLSTSQTEMHNLRDEIHSLTTSTEWLSASLESSKITVTELRSELAEAKGLEQQLFADLSQKAAILADLEASKEDALAAVATLSAEVEGLQATVSHVQMTLDTTRTALERSTDESARLSHDHTEKEQVIVALTAQLSTVEATRDGLSVQLTERDNAMIDLRSELTASELRAETLQTALNTSHVEKATSDSTYEDRITSLTSALESTRGDVTKLRSQLTVADSACTDASHQLDLTNAELTSLRSALDDERARVADLRNVLADAATRAQDAEEEIVALKESKVADEVTITGLKDAYARIRKVQMDSLAELDQKIDSAHSSPLPKRCYSPTKIGEVM